MRYVPTQVGGRAERAPVRAWQVLSSAFADEPGEAISLPGFDAQGWYAAPPRSTVMAALLANGLFPGIERSRAMAEVDKAQFEVPWWYRAAFDLSSAGTTAVRLDGVLHRADLFVNGEQVAAASQTAGAYTVTEVDVSELVHSGRNALALLVYPGSPQEDLSVSWVDWAPPPPDNNMGVWRDVVVERTGEARLGRPLVLAELALPGLASADVAVSVELSNLSGRDVVAQVRGLLSGNGALVPFGEDVALSAGSHEYVSFTPATVPGLHLEAPALWWPVGEGGQALYDLHLSAYVNGYLSDQRTTRFGVRSVGSYVAQGGGRRFVVNGREVQVVGGGWSPDLFLRHDPVRTAAALSYALDMGLNAVRLEGKLENEEFFEMTDANGLMVLAGWECCSKWEAEKCKGEPWSEDDFVVAERQMASEAMLLRDHPSVIAFLIGSDFAPPPRAAAIYVAALGANNWTASVVSSATAEGTDAAGPSGMKMTGPYSYVPPVYWYSRDERYGGAVGFNSETSAGNTLPCLASLRRALSEEEIESLWREPEAKQFHAAPPSEFDNLAVFHRALAGRYGRPTSLEDFCRKAQLANYETVRAQFEAYLSCAWGQRPATGLIYWMLNSPWPSLNWQLFDWYLGTGGAYFGAKKANQVLHPTYNYGDGTVQVVNRGQAATGPLELAVAVRGVDGALVAGRRYQLGTVPPRSVLTAASALDEGTPEVPGPTYFLDLSLGQPGDLGTRNTYWLSSAPDVLDWEGTTFFYTPLAQFADMTGLERLPEATVDVEVVHGPTRRGRGSVRVELRNSSAAGTPAVGLHASLLAQGAGAGDEARLVAPVLWDDNYVTLFAGESALLRAGYPAGRYRRPMVEIAGFNVAPALLPSVGTPG